MPFFYDYRCDACGERFELSRSLADRDAPARCPVCGAGGAKRCLPRVNATIRGSHGSAMRETRGMGACGGGG